MPLVLPNPPGGKTRAELRAIVESHGFNHYDPLRINLLIDQAASEVHNEADWPYKEGEQVGALPLLVEDLSQLRRVALYGRTVSLPVHDADSLSDQYGDLLADNGGQALAAWVHQGRIVRSYPPSRETVSVHYMSTSCWSSGGEVAADDDDVPLVPARFQDVIVFIAVAGCYGEDNQAESSGYMARAERRFEQMRFQLLSVNRDQPRSVRTGFNNY